jgi:tetratricopeptide (TPR) repeat protein
MKTLTLVATLIALAGCASSLKVKTDPIDTEIYVLNRKTGEKKPLGKGPLEISAAEVRKKVGEEIRAGDYFELNVEKSGYIPEKLLVPVSKSGFMITSLEVTLKKSDLEKQASTAKGALAHLVLAQRFASHGEFDRAQIQVDQLLADFPDFPRALSMRGSILYLQKNYDESLKWYEKAVAADPNMEDAVKMMSKIRSQQKERGRKP